MPIMMTTLTTIGGLLSLMLSPGLFVPLGTLILLTLVGWWVIRARDRA